MQCFRLSIEEPYILENPEQGIRNPSITKLLNPVPAGLTGFNQDAAEKFTRVKQELVDARASLDTARKLKRELRSSNRYISSYSAGVGEFYGRQDSGPRRGCEPSPETPDEFVACLNHGGR